MFVATIGASLNPMCFLAKILFMLLLWHCILYICLVSISDQLATQLPNYHIPRNVGNHYICGWTEIAFLKLSRQIKILWWPLV